VGHSVFLEHLIFLSFNPFEAWSSSKYYLKIHFLPERRHNSSPLQWSIG
jgi:hypothetical protein